MRLATALSALVGLSLVSVAVAEDVAVVEDPALKVPARPSEWNGNINGYLGGKALDRGDWKPVDGHVAFGAQFDIGHRSWPVNLAANLMYSVAQHKDDATDVTTSAGISELQLGVRKIWSSAGHFNFSLAGGFEVVGAYKKIDNGTTEVHDSAGGIGVWLSGGCYWNIGGHFNLGPQMTVSAAEVTLFGKNLNAGGLNVGLVAGYHW